jgi:hypothetical protein
MSMPTLSHYTARQLEIEQVSRAYDRGVQSLAAARATVALIEKKQAARLAEIRRQISLGGFPWFEPRETPSTLPLPRETSKGARS